jgi:hypothetical protein
MSESNTAVKKLPGSSQSIGFGGRMQSGVAERGSSIRQFKPNSLSALTKKFANGHSVVSTSSDMEKGTILKPKAVDIFLGSASEGLDEFVCIVDIMTKTE